MWAEADQLQQKMLIIINYSIIKIILKTNLTFENNTLLYRKPWSTIQVNSKS
jgi:hypothetical protein